MKRIYLDWNATAPLLPEVSDAMVKAMSTIVGNASSVHQEGQAARTQVERTRRAVAKALNAPPQAIVLTGGATESNNLVLRDYIARHPEAALFATVVEHPSVIEVVEDLQAKGTTVHRLAVLHDGTLAADALASLKAGDLVSVMWANNEIGNIYPVREIADRVHAMGGRLHVDATQALGRVPVDFADSEADFMSLSFHKMGGPKGIGALLVREGNKVERILSGGHQERGRRPGTENVPAAAGLEAAMNVLQQCQSSWQATLKHLQSVALSELRTIEGFELRGALSSGGPSLPNTINFAFEGLDGEDLLLALDLAGVALSSGSACTAGSLEPSHVVVAMGFPHTEARRSIRMSFGPSTHEAEVVDACGRIAQTVDRLRRI
ncbi:MAG: cysteine desulfurase family protein [bacterium]